MSPWKKPPPAKPGGINRDLLDRFTLAHAAIGALYGLIGLSLPWMLVLAVGWELVEDPLKAYLPRLFPHGTSDTLRNAVGDVVAVIGGWWIARLALV